MGRFSQGVVDDDDSIAWEEEKSTTVALKSSFSSSPFPGDRGRERHLGGLLVCHHRRGQSPSPEANGAGAEGLRGSQRRGFDTGRSTVVVGQGAVQEV